jgi:ketosteroid isomerase-like protein
MGARAVKLVEKFWELMATNDFRSVGSVLADNFVLDWPQSGERIRGRDNYAAMNEQYPAKGRWTFTINRIVGNDDEAVSDVSVTDGFQKARAISFFTVTEGKISRTVEYWPEPFAPFDNRKHLVERIDSLQTLSPAK